jgi:hypothetical protein
LYRDNKIGPGSFFPDPVSPADQARTWVTYFDENDKDKFHWSILPLHLAIILDAPFTTIRRLVELYPDSVKCTDDQNMLPLHIAMRHGSSNRVVDFLFCAFPDALNAKGKNDLTPLECAIQGRDIVRARILNTFIEKSNDKATEIAASQFTEKIASLKERIRSRECALGDAKSKLVVLEELNELVAQLKESENAEAAFKIENYTTDGAVSELGNNGTDSEHCDIVTEEPLQNEEEEPKQQEPVVNEEVFKTGGKNLVQHVQPHPDRLSKGIKKITNSFLRRGGKDKTEFIRSLSSNNSTDLDSSRHPSKNNDHANEKSKTGPQPASDDWKDHSSPNTEHGERSASDHGSLSKKTFIKTEATSPMWSFLKGKERSDNVSRTNSKMTRAYSEGKVIRQKSKGRLTENSKEKSSLSKSDHFVDQGDERVPRSKRVEKPKEDQRVLPDTKETNMCLYPAVEAEKGNVNNDIVMEQVGQESEKKMTGDVDRAVKKDDDTKTRKVTSNPLSSNGGKEDFPATATSNAVKNQENVDQRHGPQPANVDKVDGRIPPLPPRPPPKKSLTKKQKESNKNMAEPGSKKKHAPALDPNKIPQTSQRSTSMKNTVENLAVTRNSDSLKQKIEDPSAIHRRSIQKHPQKVVRSSLKVQQDGKEPTSKVKRDRSMSRSRARRPLPKEERVDITEQQRSKSERREAAPSSIDNNRSNSSSMVKTVRNPSSPRQGSSDIVPTKSTLSRIDKLMQETASEQQPGGERPIAKAPPKQKLSSKAKHSLPPPRSNRQKSIERVKVAAASSGDDDGSDSHSDEHDSNTYSSDDGDDSISAYSDDVTGSSEQSLITGSSCSSTTPSEDSTDSWNPWKNVWTM